MACPDPDTVLAWLDGRLTAHRVEAVESHVDVCSTCRRLINASGGDDDEKDAGVPDRLGPYEVRGVIGRGGMGEVYRAYDPRLDREVAVKVVRRIAGRRMSPEDVDWFERETRAAAAIAHPNVMAVFDVGRDGGVPYVVTELLAGETLRSRLRAGPINHRQAITRARDLAHGMAAAHDGGVVHRDLKPENVFLTTDGRVKLLDFGVARFVGSRGAGGDDLELDGLVVGTLGYMAPEQIRGEAVDHRADVFAFGAVLYEMLTGRAAFGADDLERAEMALEQDPFERDADASADVAPPLVQIVRRCLEKDPAARFQSARDLAFALDMLGTVVSPPDRVRPRRKRRTMIVLAVIAAGVAAVAVGWFARDRRPAVIARAATVEVSRIDLRRAQILAARFAADGETILASAAFGDLKAWDTSSLRVMRAGAGDRTLGESTYPPGLLRAVAADDRVAITRDGRVFPDGSVAGRLAVYRAGDSGRETGEPFDGITSADFLPTEGLAVLRGPRIEAPIGTVVVDTAPTAFPSGLRVAHDGTIAYIVRPFFGNEEAQVAQVAATGGTPRVIASFLDASGLAWVPGRKQLVVSGASEGGDGLWLVGTAAPTLLWSGLGRVVIEDIAPDGTILVRRDLAATRVQVRTAAYAGERDASWEDRAQVIDLSLDGRRVALLGPADAHTGRAALYVRATDGPGGVAIADGIGGSLSADGTRLLARSPRPPWKAVVYTTTPPIEATVLDPGSLVDVIAGGWHGDDVLLLGKDGAGRVALYRQRPDTAAAPIEVGTWPLDWKVGRAAFDPTADKPLTTVLGASVLAWSGFKVSPDGRWIATYDAAGPVLVDTTTLATRRIGALADASVFGWGAASDAVFVQAFPADGNVAIDRIDLTTGARHEVARFTVPVGAIAIDRMCVVADGTSYAYSYRTLDAELYTIRGLLPGGPP